ncbi:MAG TPA: M20/M25/M40 family metallo-hydrolase [bacterium]|nr:M20/M25/M40 family metallo-hydrolase [bacterium]
MKNNPNRLLDIFLKLTSIDGISGREKEVKDYITDFLNKLGYDVEEDNAGKSINGNSGNIICKIGTGGDFILLSHMDTARPTKNLRHRIHEDRITSDGSTILGADNRAGIAAILYNLEKAYREKIPLSDFTIGFTISEENNLEGSKALELNSHINRGFVIDSSLRPGQFIYSTYGAQGIDITIKGKAAHSGLQPEDGVSSIQVAARAIAELKLGRIDHQTTANLGIIKGGSAVNVIPEETTINGEVRSLSNQRAMEIVDKFKTRFIKVCKAFGADLDFQSNWDFKPYKISEKSRVYQDILKVYKQLGLKPRPVVSAGGSDANSLNAKGVEAINIGIGAQNPHSNDEFILLEDLSSTANIIHALIREN